MLKQFRLLSWSLATVRLFYRFLPYAHAIHRSGGQCRELSFSLLEMESGIGRAVFLIFFCSVGQGGEGKRVDEFLDSMVAHQ